MKKLLTDCALLATFTSAPSARADTVVSMRLLLQSPQLQELLRTHPHSMVWRLEYASSDEGDNMDMVIGYPDDEAFTFCTHHGHVRDDEPRGRQVHFSPGRTGAPECQHGLWSPPSH